MAKKKNELGMIMMPEYMVLSTINVLIEELNARGTKIVNWDDRGKALYGVQRIGNKVVFLTEDVVK